MLKVSIAYVQDGSREMPLIESVEVGTVRATAKRILKEYSDGASRCQDEVMATLLHEETRQAVNVLRAAGIDVYADGVA